MALLILCGTVASEHIHPTLQTILGTVLASLVLPFAERHNVIRKKKPHTQDAPL